MGLRLLDRRGDEDFFSWAAVRREARRVAASLAAAGVRRGERVALVYPTGRGFFRAFFGILEAGAVPVPLYPPVRLGRLDEYHRRTAAMLGAASARLVLTDRRIRSLLGETMERARPELGCRLLDELPAAAGEPPGAPTEADVGPDDLALVQFSSGTTVDPKPVALSHRAILAQVEALNSFWPDPGSDHGEDCADLRVTGMSWLPLYHDMGLIGCVFPALERPSVLTLLGPETFVARPARWLQAISRHRATISVAPNFAYGLCVEKVRDEEMEGVDLSPWRVALNGAEPVSPGVLRAFQERFGRWGFRPEALTPVYGLSEATLAVTFSDLETPFRVERFDRDELARDRAVPAAGGRELVSVGRPLPGTEVRIVGDERRPADPGVVGTVEARGESIMQGYLDRPEATARALRHGWLDTGDRGFLQDGELFLVGREKDLLILRGRNHPPQAVEQAVDTLPGARRGCAVAVSHLPEETSSPETPSATEELLLFVEHAKDADPSEVEALPERAVEAVLATEGLRPDRVLVLSPGTLPRTSSGKLRRAETLRRHLANELHAPRKVGAVTLLCAWVRSALAYLRRRLG